MDAAAVLEHDFDPLTGRCRACWLRRKDAAERPGLLCPGYDGGVSGGAKVAQESRWSLERPESA